MAEGGGALRSVFLRLNVFICLLIFVPLLFCLKLNAEEAAKETLESYTTTSFTGWINLDTLSLIQDTVSSLLTQEIQVSPSLLYSVIPTILVTQVLSKYSRDLPGMPLMVSEINTGVAGKVIRELSLFQNLEEGASTQQNFSQSYQNVKKKQLARLITLFTQLARQLAGAFDGLLSAPMGFELFRNILKIVPKDMLQKEASQIKEMIASLSLSQRSKLEMLSLCDAISKDAFWENTHTIEKPNWAVLKTIERLQRELVLPIFALHLFRFYLSRIYPSSQLHETLMCLTDHVNDLTLKLYGVSYYTRARFKVDIARRYPEAKNDLAKLKEDLLRASTLLQEPSLVAKHWRKYRTPQLAPCQKVLLLD